jgi:ribosomal protein S18 acetylase RimI-like enzyme
MHIYRADLRDLAACLALDGSYDTDFVRQVTQIEEDDQVVTRFRVAALPRTMHVAYPSWGEALLAHQERGDLILVAAEAAEVRGYINVETQADQGLAWLHHLVIAPPFRRQGLAQMMTLVQSKNHPAIKFLERNRFAFCGYNERFYRNKDIGLYFVRGL